jgi:hypothetical protein
MNLEYKNYQIEVLDDNKYSTNSVDNLKLYKNEYNNGKLIEKRAFHYASKHGIRVREKYNENEISSVILCEYGGATTVHDKSFFIANDKIWICVCDKIYCLNLPSLKIHWFNRIDYVTNFSINPFKNDFIIHGELEIIRIGQNGEIKWRFGGRDIFVSTNKNINFKINDDSIEVTDWEGYKYLIDENGNEKK